MPRFHHPQDPNTAANQFQFFYGPSLLISPVIEDNATDVEIYLPKEPYYDFSTLKRIDGTGNYIHLTNIPFTDIPVHVRGGSIVPLRVSGANTTTELRKKDFELLIAPDVYGFAKGELYIDDGESLVQEKESQIWFDFSQGILEMKGRFGYDVGDVKIVKVTVMGDVPVTKRVDVPLARPFTGVIELLPDF
jgi:alpha-glucosidase